MGLAGPRPVPTGRAHLAGWRKALLSCGSREMLPRVLAKYDSRADGTPSMEFEFVVVVPELNTDLFHQTRTPLKARMRKNS